jgi:hypothetical protein
LRSAVDRLSRLRANVPARADGEGSCEEAVIDLLAAEGPLIRRAIFSALPYSERRVAVALRALVNRGDVEVQRVGHGGKRLYARV